ncbi:hypothetical protein ACIQVL_38345 [Streptomyces sp. NPDC090499]|uniref:hypothetical protein n=1 Tax=Streptomyces sp. NPDC090499 TaxID=3365965 RepID=UPI00381DBDF2
MHSQGRCRWLERANLTVACAVAVMYLAASNLPVDPTRERLGPGPRAEQPCCTAEQIAALLRTW